MRTIAVVTVGRSDYGLYLPILRRLSGAPDVRCAVVAAGMHMSAEHGLTVKAIERDGFDIAERVPLLADGDGPVAVAASIGRGVAGYAEALDRVRPDILVVLGDRFDMYAAAVAALPLRIPVAHIHGGELTFGAIDDALRHSMTKLSHLHFVATREYGWRVEQMGEEPWRITVSGAPGLDTIADVPPLQRPALSEALGVDAARPFLLATFHPVTLEHERTSWHVTELLAALDEIGLPVVFTQANADTGGRVVRTMIEAFVARTPVARLVNNLGTQAYLSAMGTAAAMVGNSSSGIIEAASFALPVVNIGTRQDGRLRAANVIDVGYPRAEVRAGLRRALDPAFRASLDGLVNPYGDGHAAARIVHRLVTEPLGAALLQKRFHDLPMPAPGEVSV